MILDFTSLLYFFLSLMFFLHLLCSHFFVHYSSFFSGLKVGRVVLEARKNERNFFKRLFKNLK